MERVGPAPIGQLAEVLHLGRLVLGVDEVVCKPAELDAPLRVVGPLDGLGEPLELGDVGNEDVAAVLVVALHLLHFQGVISVALRAVENVLTLASESNAHMHNKQGVTTPLALVLSLCPYSLNMLDTTNNTHANGLEQSSKRIWYVPRNVVGRNPEFDKKQKKGV